MIFTGDIAIPYSGAITYELPDFFYDQTWVSNLEGGLINDEGFYLNQKKVFNSISAISELNRVHDVYFSLCNNHSFDTSYKDTHKLAVKNNIRFFGAGSSISEAKKPLVLRSDEIVILNFGWSVIGCKIAKNRNYGCNPFQRENVKESVKKVKLEFPNYRIFCYFHWGYELEKYPLPLDRKIAYEAIDLGCDGVVGTHSHRVQGFEIYKEKPIVYSLGNFLFPQGVFWKGKLSFPDDCNLQAAFEFDDRGQHKIHYTNYDRKRQHVEYIKSEVVNESESMNRLSQFRDIDIESYNEWFKNKRYHSFLMPIYYHDDSKLVILIKDKLNFLRNSSISILYKLKLFYIIKKLLFKFIRR